MADQIEILLKTDSKPEAMMVSQLLDEMTTEEQKNILLFMQGIRFAKGFESRAETSKVVNETQKDGA